MVHTRIKYQAVDVEGNPIGVANDKSIMDTRQYEVEYNTRETETLSENIIAENLISQFDEEGHRQLMIDKIEEHKTKKEDICVSAPRRGPHLMAPNK